MTTCFKASIDYVRTFFSKEEDAAMVPLRIETPAAAVGIDWTSMFDCLDYSHSTPKPLCEQATARLASGRRRMFSWSKDDLLRSFSSSSHWPDMSRRNKGQFLFQTTTDILAKIGSCSFRKLQRKNTTTLRKFSAPAKLGEHRAALDYAIAIRNP